MTGPYDDIIHLPHHVSAARPHMPAADRAAQFAPFAALTGHGAAIHETARLTDARKELSTDAKTALAEKLNLLMDKTIGHPEITVTYFRPDERKTGGCYVAATGIFKTIDDYRHVIVMMDGCRIPVGDILEIQSELFQSF